MDSKRVTKATVLVVDDEHEVRQSLNMALKDDYHVILAGTGRGTLNIFEKNSVDVILLDLLLPDINGIDILDKLKTMDPNVEVIMVTAVKEIQTAVRAIKMGAYEYLVKPFVVDEVLNTISRALEKRTLMREVTYLRKELERYHSFEHMVGEDKKMKEVFSLIATIADSDGPVLIQGESGTGKGLVARAIHNRGPRQNHPFVVINCAAIPVTLMESELFGYNRGAFTGATSTTVGKLEIAHKGTVFLDDIDSLDLSLQAKLLRVVQEKEFERLGSHKLIKVDIRFIAASNKDLGKLISESRLREDLFYRLNVFPIEIPPLRKRKGDLPLLLDYFVESFSKRTGKPQKRFSRKALESLTTYDWPGNVRELENLVERLCTVVSRPVIQLQDITRSNIPVSEIKGFGLKEAVNAFERKYIMEVLESVGWSRKEAADVLQVHRNTLLAKITELGLKA